ncbi:MAG: chemotaxis protein CheC [Bacillota bacterium]
MEWENLTDMHLDALKEVGNIGVGNAATALSHMLNRVVGMEVPKVGVLPLEDIFALIGGEEDLVACVILTISGQAPGYVLFLIGEDSAYNLVDMLMCNPPGTTQSVDDLAQSALAEVGNILAGAFLNAFSIITQMEFIASVPAFAFDMLGAVLTTALIESGHYEARALIIETRIYNEQVNIDGHFFLVPEVGSLSIILGAMGLTV